MESGDSEEYETCGVVTYDATEERANSRPLGSALCVALSNPKVASGAVGSGAAETKEFALAESRFEHSDEAAVAVCDVVATSTGVD